MNFSFVTWAVVAVLALAAIAGFGWILSLPPAPALKIPPAIADDETGATLAGLKPPKRTRPVIAVIGINDATETTDYLMPLGILRRADVADVFALATGPGPVKLYPALKVQPQATIGDFDTQYPDGADYVIVPAMSRDDDPAALRWIRSQAAKGAIVIGVCAGAKVVAAAGLLDDRRATTHWYYLDKLRSAHPAMRYVANRRYVVDPPIVTTTGISASMPMSLTLIEAIAGRPKAESVAAGLGLADWDARHDSEQFRFTRPFALAALGNALSFWNRETFSIELTPDIDEVSLALVADAWSRTYRSHAETFSRIQPVLSSRNGVAIVADRIGAALPEAKPLPAIERRPAEELDAALGAIAERYGSRTARFVAMQLEYPAGGPQRIRETL